MLRIMPYFCIHMEAAKLVSGAIIGIDGKTVIINSKPYYIAPPTIRRIAGAGYYLCDIPAGGTAREILSSFRDFKKLCKALSWFIKGDDTLAEELSNGTLTQVVDALCEAYELVGAKNFSRLSLLTRNVKEVTAKQR